MLNNAGEWPHPGYSFAYVDWFRYATIKFNSNLRVPVKTFHFI